MRAFYRWSLLLPILLPAVALALAFITPNNSLLLPIIGMLLASAIYGGAAYVVLALSLLVWMRGRSDGEISRVAWFAPVLMLFAEAIVLPLQAVLFDNDFALPNSEGAFSAVAFLSMVVLILGYFYVVLLKAIVYVGRRRGWIT